MSVKTIENMVNWIEDNIMRNPTLTEMSNYVGYSPFYCSSKFHENVGVTFKQYISKRRLSLAAIKVKDTKIRFLDIALKYGFSSQEAFTRAFVSNYGCTPNEYRKKKLTNIELYMKPNIFPVSNNKDIID
ncbi:helix-turn-helix transcriptional regulator [Clostridium botulinum]|uniref:Helix-turn-helix transcriptional regulator n=2 Tax=Clostridium botulinum TaxID=1491 RepID=A0A6B4G353_CLOBO|nr:AraC family transcriptional regulator [Clostridium botulinum]MBD5589434.1 helix-turn-helix transcriptional regulator [Clostridium botulinum]MBN3371913.1 AraC family transcriptional regulator [Clostridium botulinum]MBN3384491.1 AraC family transcriptional regulator [Clostridium botulinum]MBN3392130.1 AraC family transcriptional regulator [Clostridium botulinum]MBN3432545.1 AraC family transcriptional regulator [Clostridium botulinum]